LGHSDVITIGITECHKRILCLYVPTRALRSSASKLVQVQVPRINLQFGSRSVRVSAPSLWNSLPQRVCFCESLTIFWKHLKTCYIQAP